MGLFKNLRKLPGARYKNHCGKMTKEYEYKIEGGVHPPVRQYPLNSEVQKELTITLKELEQQGVIKEINPITNSPIQGVKKSDQTWRAVINYKALNRRTKADQRSLINPSAALKNIPTKRYKTCIDLANGFWSMPLAAESQERTAFTMNNRSYVWTRLPQGFQNSPNAFQAAVKQVLDGEEVEVYIDDVYITDEDPEEHAKRVLRVCSKLTNSGLLLNVKKCQIGMEKVKYLGFEVGEAISIAKEYKERIRESKPPNTIKDLQQFLGLTNYVRDHVPGFQKLAKPKYIIKKVM